jgi:large subunit ribosomal protein L6
LKFVGVGYRAIPVDGFRNKLFMLKLGYSHLIYFKVPDNFEIACFKKFTNLFIAGDFYQPVSQIASLIRVCKPPEPYKGKGILYVNEHIKLKQGKRI